MHPCTESKALLKSKIIPHTSLPTSTSLSQSSAAFNISSYGGLSFFLETPLVVWDGVERLKMIQQYIALLCLLRTLLTKDSKEIGQYQDGEPAVELLGSSTIKERFHRDGSWPKCIERLNIFVSDGAIVSSMLQHCDRDSVVLHLQCRILQCDCLVDCTMGSREERQYYKTSKIIHLTYLLIQYLL